MNFLLTNTDETTHMNKNFSQLKITKLSQFSKLATAIIAAACYSSASQAEVAVLQTDITPESTYAVASFGKATLSQDINNGFRSQVVDTDYNVTSFDLISSGKATGNLTPIISMGSSIIEIEEDGEDKQHAINFKAGFLLDSGDKRHLVYAGYDVRGADYFDTYEIGAVLRASDIENTTAGVEFEFNASFNEDADGVSGGETYTVSSNAKIKLSPQLYLTASVSLGYETDTEYDDGSSIETGAVVGSELGLVLQANENIQLRGAIFNSLKTQEYYDTNSVNQVSNEEILTGAGVTLTVAM